MKKRTKKYDPNRWRRQIEQSMERRVSKLPLANEQALDLGVAMRLAYDALISGDSQDHVHTLIAVMDVALILADEVGQEYKETIQDALDGLERASKRQPNRMDGDGMQALKLAMEVHEEQLKIATREEVKHAIHTIYERIAKPELVC